MVKFLFPKKLRLLTQFHFNFVLENPKKIETTQIVILSRLNTIGHPRIGLAISKKNIRLSHERNRIKRIIRESFRLHQNILPSMDFIIIAKKELIKLNNSNIMGDLKKIWLHYSYLLRNY